MTKRKEGGGGREPRDLRCYVDALGSFGVRDWADAVSKEDVHLTLVCINLKVDSRGDGCLYSITHDTFELGFCFVVTNYTISSKRILGSHIMKDPIS